MEDEKEIRQNIKAYPNPFSDKLNLVFTLPEATDVKMAIYDYSGRNVYLTDMGLQQAGEQRFSFTPNLAQGVYIVKIVAGKHTYQTIVVKEGGLR